MEPDRARKVENDEIILFLGQGVGNTENSHQIFDFRATECFAMVQNQIKNLIKHSMLLHVIPLCILIIKITTAATIINHYTGQRKPNCTCNEQIIEDYWETPFFQFSNKSNICNT